MEQKTGWFVIRPSNDDIVHYGVDGQEWGKRRYQNKDGSLTPLGRRHYGYGSGRQSNKDDDDDRAYSGTVEGEGKSKGGSSSGSSRRTYTDANPNDYREANNYSGTVEGEGKSKRNSSSSNRNYTDANPRDYRPADDNDTNSTNGPSKKEQKAQKKAEKQQAKAERAAAQEVARRAKEQAAAQKNGDTARKLGDVKKVTDTASSLLERSVKKAEERAKAKLDVSNLSNEEMQAYITRQALESKYKNLVVDGNVARGRQRLDSILKTTGSILAVGVSAATLAKTIHELRK